MWFEANSLCVKLWRCSVCFSLHSLIHYLLLHQLDRLLAKMQVVASNRLACELHFIVATSGWRLVLVIACIRSNLLANDYNIIIVALVQLASFCRLTIIWLVKRSVHILLIDRSHTGWTSFWLLFVNRRHTSTPSNFFGYLIVLLKNRMNRWWYGNYIWIVYVETLYVIVNDIWVLQKARL